jgi:hypothetical protein
MYHLYMLLAIRLTSHETLLLMDWLAAGRAVSPHKRLQPKSPLSLRFRPLCNLFEHLTMASQQQQQQQGGHLVRSTGLTEALWACVLDDYLSEEEEGEFNRILGNTEKVPWYLRPEVVACSATPRKSTRRIRAGDPRDARARGGRDPDSSDEERDGTPGVWDEASAPEMPPVMWLSVPPEGEAKQEPDWDTPVDWDTPRDWDMNVKLHRMKQQQKKQKQKRAGTEDTTDYQSATGSMSSPTRLASKSPSRISDLFPTTTSLTSSDHRSRSTKSTKPRNMSKSQATRDTRGKGSSNWETLVETRQSEQSRSGDSQSRRQSTETLTRSGSTSPPNDSRNAKSRDIEPSARTMSSKKQFTSKWRRANKYVI